MTKTIMFLGTGSDVGKSIAVTAFCRILKRRGYSIAPFKAQNMSNNSYVTVEGGEIGRAQVVQAEAAGVLPSIHMNPILLKPSGNKGTQVVLHGKVAGDMNATTYHDMKPRFKRAIRESFEKLASQYDVIVMEGAGSCCEMNLKNTDLVNLPLAKSLKVPCVLVGDIDRGGVFAQLIGSYQLMTPAERRLIKGFLINKFRGDAALFTSGIEYIEKKTNKPVLGLVPYFHDIHIDSEDSVILQADKREAKPSNPKSINIGVLRLPAISNFTDLEILEREPDVVIHYLSRSKELLDDYDCLILPGTKNVMEDAVWLARTGWKKAIIEFAANGKRIIGICGGYQFLGKRILDPLGVESDRKTVQGIGLLPIETNLETNKIVRKVRGISLINKTPVEGYEIHMGQTRDIEKIGTPFLRLYSPDKSQAWEEGWTINKGRISGTYLHGLFDASAFRDAFLNDLRKTKNLPLKKSKTNRKSRYEQYDRLAHHFETHCDVDAIIQNII